MVSKCHAKDCLSSKIAKQLEMKPHIFLTLFAWAVVSYTSMTYSKSMTRRTENIDANKKVNNNSQLG